MLDKLASKVIDQCFDVDRNFAIDIIRNKPTTFHNTLLRVAMKANCRSFLASKSVQKYLDNLWLVETIALIE